MKYRLGKLQVRRLINGQDVVDGHGIRYHLSNEEILANLRYIDGEDLYGVFDIFLEGRNIFVSEKSTEVRDEWGAESN